MNNVELGNSGFLHISAEGWLSPPRRLSLEQSENGGGRRYLDPPPAKISAFYVNDLSSGQIQFSFAFLSPEDAKLGLFNKSEGRMRTLRRFYGIDGVDKSSVVLNYNEDDEPSPHDIAIAFLMGVRDGFNITVSHGAFVEFTEDTFPRHRIVCYDNGNEVEINHVGFAIAGVIGIIKVPDWLNNSFWIDDWRAYNYSISVEV